MAISHFCNPGSARPEDAELAIASRRHTLPGAFHRVAGGVARK